MNSQPAENAPTAPQEPPDPLSAVSTLPGQQSVNADATQPVISAAGAGLHRLDLLSDADRERAQAEARRLRSPDTLVGHRDACAWLVAKHVVWVQVRRPHLAGL